MMQLVERYYRLLVRVSSSLQSPFLLAVRLYWGWQFMPNRVGKAERHRESRAILHQSGYTCASPERIFCFGARSSEAACFLSGARLATDCAAPCHRHVRRRPRRLPPRCPCLFLFHANGDPLTRKHLQTSGHLEEIGLALRCVVHILGKRRPVVFRVPALAMLRIGAADDLIVELKGRGSGGSGAQQHRVVAIFEGFLRAKTALSAGEIPMTGRSSVLSRRALISIRWSLLSGGNW